MNLNFLPNRLDIQIATYISLLLFISIGIFTFHNVHHSVNDVTESFTQQAKLTAQHVALSAGYALNKKNEQLLTEKLTQEMQQKEVNNIVVVNLQGQNLASVSRNSLGETIVSTQQRNFTVPNSEQEKIKLDDKFINVWTPFIGNTTSGWIRVQLDLQEIQSHRTEHISASIIFAFITILGTFIATLLLLNKPFKYIKEATKFAELLDSSNRGNLRPFPSAIELKALGESLNLASHRLAVNEKEILNSLELLETQTFAMDQHSIVSITDIQGLITYANNKFCQVTEYSRSELIGKSHSLLKSSHHNREFFQNLWSTISSGNVWQGEICNKTKSGKEYWTNTTIVPFLDKNNIPYQYVAIRNDITTLKKVTEDLFKSQQRLQQSQQFANIGSWEMELSGKEVYLSDNALKLLGNPQFPEKITSSNYLDVIYPQDRDNVINSIKKCIETGEMYQTEYRVIWPDNSLHWIQDNGNVLRDDKGDALKILGISQDITERKMAAQEIESLARFPNENPNPIMRISHKMQLLYGNPSASELMKAWNITVGDTIPDNIISIAQKNIALQKSSTAEIRVNNQNYSITFAYVKNSSYLNLYIQDITERKAAEQTIKNYQRHLEDLVEERTEDLVKARDAALSAERSMSTFLANMSHELRTPLHAVLSFADFGMKKIDRVSKEKIVQYFLKIHQSGNHLLGLVNNLLDLSKLRAGKMSYHYTDSKFAPIIQQVLNELTLIAKKKNIELIFEDSSSDLRTFIDIDRISQVMRNLISNAIKFSPDNENIFVKLGTLGSEAIEVSVIDNGVGIPEKELELIFESFVQSSKTNTHAGGTGLGLPICREIINGGHGGWITANNLPEGGAIFSFWIPIQQRKNEPSYLHSSEKHAE